MTSRSRPFDFSLSFSILSKGLFLLQPRFENCNSTNESTVKMSVVDESSANLLILLNHVTHFYSLRQ